jgi:hypothetical protein
MADPPRYLEYMPLLDLYDRRDPANVKSHADADITASITRFGYAEPVLLDERTGRLIAGHGRIERLRDWYENGAAAYPPEGIVMDPDGVWTVPVIRGWSSQDDDEARAFMVTTNRLTELGGWTDALGPLLADLQPTAGGLPPGFTPADVDALLADLNPPAPVDPPAPNPSLFDRFVIPPFSVLDARSGVWRERKARWMSLGIRSEIGRDDGATAIKGTGAQVYNYYDQKNAVEARLGRQLSVDEFEAEYLVMPTSSSVVAGGVSVFDPVLCELAYRWFCPPDGFVFDPFAGGSVRGIVAAALGRRYLGYDLSMEQVEANRQQAADILPALGVDGGPFGAAQWENNDAVNPQLADNAADMLFSCPPYADLERYSDDPRDLSVMSWPQFRDAYRQAIRLAVARLRDDRFAVWMVGEVRDRQTGMYRGLVPATIDAFRDAGMAFYNEASYVAPVSSVRITVGRQFTASRKLGKTHQNLLVFVKGDPVKATEACGPVSVHLDLGDAILIDPLLAGP